MEKIVERKLLKTILRVANRKEFIGIRGPRQSGKTTLLRLLEKKLKGHENVFVNMDLPDNRHEFEENPLDFVKRHKAGKKKLLLFMDEVQGCKNAGKSLKIIYDSFEDVKVIFSGSSSLEIKTGILPSLVGRTFIFDLLPFDFEESLAYKDNGLAEIFRDKKKSVFEFVEHGRLIKKPSMSAELMKHMKKYAVFGGYPEVVKAGTADEKIILLNTLRTLYLEKDVISFFGVRDADKFEIISRVLAFQASNILNVSNTSKSCGITLQKAEEFLAILKQVFVIDLLTPFHRNLITELRKAKKIYFFDAGLRNSLLRNFIDFDKREDAGKMMENFVFRELISSFPDWELNYWRTSGKAEVDFVLSKEGTLLPVEVKINETTIGKSFYSFLESYKPKRAIIITMNYFEKRKVGDTIVYFLPAHYL